MRVRILPYRRGSQSARLLSELTGFRRARRTNSQFAPRSNDLVINWGCAEDVFPGAHYLNRPECVALAVDKLKTFSQFARYEVPCPAWTTDIRLARHWAQMGFRVFCRTAVQGRGGRGIVVATTPDDVVEAPLYTQDVMHQQEYRIHVFKGEIIDRQEKRRRRGATIDRLVRNHDGGWVFCREGVEEIPEVDLAARRATAALGLDFCGVDVAYRPGDRSAFVLEGNSAPGVEGTTAESYAAAFRRQGAVAGSLGT